MFKRLKGFTLIELLIVVAIIAILAAIAVPNFLEAQVRSKVSRVRSDLRSLTVGIESYYVDNNIYPAQASSNSANGNFGANEFDTASERLKAMPTFRLKSAHGSAGGNMMTITTPIAYITSYFTDPFADSKGGTFAYSKNIGVFVGGWVTWSYGPDGDEKIESPGEYTDGGGDIGLSLFNGEPFIETAYYNINERVPSVTLINASYDPTNGTTSNGDVWRNKQ
jgi:prepilin-type N-terminal cleavage/methylation domain-containing protein